MKKIHQTEKTFHKWLISFGHILEIVLCIFVAFGLVVSLGPLRGQLRALWLGENLAFSHFLESAFNLVIGIEFIDMLTKHNPGSAMEVLLYAIVRHMVIEGGTMLDMFIGTLAILVIFIVRRYFFVRSFEEENEEKKIEGETVKDEVI